MNDVMSMGVHRIWKNEFVNSIGLLKPNTVFKDGKTVEEKMSIIDVAGGTGDIAFRIWRRAEYFAKHYLSNVLIILASFPVDITVVDINSNMLEVGKQRAIEQNILESKDLVI
jgi:2-methoxy-6-polyprenyl-1,4-benzoquinol methylase